MGCIETKSLFHLHTLASDGSIPFERIRELLFKCEIAMVIVLDHATLDGYYALKLMLNDTVIDVIPGYEHSIGNTDIGIIGINEVLPSHWNIKQISNYVHQHNGFLVYLHPMRTSRNMRELITFFKDSYIDAWEFKNNRSSLLLNKDMIPLPALSGADIHDESEWRDDIADKGTDFPPILLEKVHAIKSRFMNSSPIIKPVPFSFSATWADIIVTSQSDGRLDIIIDFQEPWGNSVDNEAPYEGDCFEFAVSTGGFCGLLCTITFNDNAIKYYFYQMSQDGIQSVLSHDMLPDECILSMNRLHVSFTILSQYRGYAFSINRTNAIPSEQRIIWPMPVWPPRNQRNYFYA